MQIVASLAAVLGMAAFAQAHMEMTNPPPLRSKSNKFTTDPDYEMKSPLGADGSNFPCRGSLGLVGTAQGKAVADWPAGSAQSLTVDGGAFHAGGSCQGSLSYDKGASWKVIHSWLGSCPTGPGATTYDFKVPADAQAGEAIFAWSWFNKVGNREMYMNCAVVNIQASKSKKRRGVAMSARPDMFVANVNNGCGTIEGKDLQFPDPGPDVSTTGNNFGGPTGKCAAGSGSPPPQQQPSSGASSSAAAPSVPVASSSSSSAAAPSPTGTRNPSPSLPGGVFATVSETTSGASSASSSSAASKPTTIQTSVRPTSGGPVATSSTPAAKPSAPAGTNPAPSATKTTPAATPAPTGGNGGSAGYAAGAACEELGSWNCIDGKQFQRCASGNRWSVAMGLAAGTACQPGVAKDIVFV